MHGPGNLKFDNSGNLYFADGVNNRVRRIDTSGIITTVAGNGTTALPWVDGASGDGGPADSAELNYPVGVTVDKSGNIYISDYNNVIRKVDAAGTITTTIAYWADDDPLGIDVDSSGNLYYTNFGGNQISEYVVSCIPIAISGADSICAGATTTVSDSVSGGIWVSSNNSAIIDSIGTVTAVNEGLDTITYTTTNVCGINSISKLISVQLPQTLSSITGADTVCPGSYITLSDSVPGGIWVATNGNVTINPDSLITGISSGSDSFLYSFIYSCGTFTITKTINVGHLPWAGTISGADTICIGTTFTFSDTIPAGIWACDSDNLSISVEGTATFSAAGMDTVFYIISNFCGADTAKKMVSVMNCTAGINNTTELANGINFYPNPAQDGITISSAKTIESVVITNVLGKQVYAAFYNANKVFLNLSELSAGVYMAEINNGEIYKIIKQ